VSVVDNKASAGGVERVNAAAAGGWVGQSGSGGAAQWLVLLAPATTTHDVLIDTQPTASSHSTAAASYNSPCRYCTSTLSLSIHSDTQSLRCSFPQTKPVTLSAFKPRFLN